MRLIIESVTVGKEKLLNVSLERVGLPTLYLHMQGYPDFHTNPEPFPDTPRSRAQALEIMGNHPLTFLD